MVITFVCLVSVLLLLSSMAVFYHVNYSLQRAYCKLCMGFTRTCCCRILSWAEIFHSSYYYSLSGSFVTFFIVVRKVIKSLNNSFCSSWNAMLWACLLVIPNGIIFYRQYCIERLMFVLSSKHFSEGCFSVECLTLERKAPKVLACEACGNERERQTGKQV